MYSLAAPWRSWRLGGPYSRIERPVSDTVYVALDVEATEMHPERGEIIELGAIKFTRERVVDRWSATVRPRGPVPFAITALTGITEEEVRRAPPFAAVVPTLAAFVRQHP